MKLILRQLQDIEKVARFQYKNSTVICVFFLTRQKTKQKINNQISTPNSTFDDLSKSHDPDTKQNIDIKMDNQRAHSKLIC